MSENERRFTRPVDPKEFPIQVEEIGILDAIECGFRQSFFEPVDLGNGRTGNVKSGAGCGFPWIVIEVDDRRFRIDARELLKAAADYTE